MKVIKNDKAVNSFQHNYINLTPVQWIPIPKSDKTELNFICQM